jgi:hypothetical protein
LRAVLWSRSIESPDFTNPAKPMARSADAALSGREIHHT